MYRDPTEFRLRFAAYQGGKLPYENGRPKAIQEVDNSDADFAKRLRSNWRLEIWDWEGSGKSVTHKMSDADNIVYPNVQTTKGGGLIDFTNPIWHGNVDPYWRAIKNNDYVPMKSEQDAMWFGPNYKKYYPGFKTGKLPGYTNGTPNIVDMLDDELLDTLHYINDYFSNLGMSTIDIAGIAANMLKESSFRHNAKDSAGYHGYVQMSPDMQLAVKAAYGNLDPDTQLLFVYDQLTGNSRVKGYTNGAGYLYGLYKTGGDAAEAFRSTFERNKAGRQQSRIDYGNLIYDYLTNRAVENVIKKEAGELPRPIVARPDATIVKKIVPKAKTRARWTGADNVSPYLTGKPMVKLLKEIKLPNIIEENKKTLWKAPMGFKNGKLPGYYIGTIPFLIGGAGYGAYNRLSSYKNGKSPIYIKPANRGKFNATKKRTGKTTEELAHSKNPLTRKRAIFALNARKWKH